MNIDAIASLLPAAGGALAALAGGVTGTKFVQEGERGIKLRFGRVLRHRDGTPKIVEPGWVWVWPSIEHLRRAHVRTDTVDLPTQTVVLKDRMTFTVSAVLIARVQDTPEAVYRCLVEVEDMHKAVTDYCTAELRTVLAGLTHEEVTHPEKVAPMITEAVRARLGEWGIDVDRVMLTDCGPTPESARAILTAAATDLRATALSAAAAKLRDDEGVRSLPPAVAAALIGTPVVTALGDAPATAVHHHGEDDYED